MASRRKLSSLQISGSGNTHCTSHGKALFPTTWCSAVTHKISSNGSQTKPSTCVNSNFGFKPCRPRRGTKSMCESSSRVGRPNHACSGPLAAADRRFEFHKSGEPFIRTHSKTLSVVAMSVNNPDCSSFAIYRRDTTPTPSCFTEIVSNDFPSTSHDGSSLPK